MHDEKTTEIELPKTVQSNIVRVNFVERRKAQPSARSHSAAAARVPRPASPRTTKTHSVPQVSWEVRLLALAAIIFLSLLVL